MFKNLTNIVPLGSDDKLRSKFTGDRKAFGKLRAVSYIVLFCILSLIAPKYKWIESFWDLNYMSLDKCNSGPARTLPQ